MSDVFYRISIETRATGIVSVVNIDEGKTSPYGNIVSPGALAQNHQHIFAVRVDPAIDGYSNTIIQEESLPIPMNEKTNPHGNGYQVISTPITESTYIDASPFTNRVLKFSNTNKKNPISGKPVSYKFTPSATQLILADPNSVAAKRAAFAHHHVWITQYRDDELWAAGEFTNQSQCEIGGVQDMVSRKDKVENDDVVVWAVFGLTHNPRVEDWPVMPMEKHELHFRPSDFFDKNPALDVPSNRNLASVLADGAQGECCAANGHHAANGTDSGSVQQAPTTHLQGTGEISVNGS